MGSAYSTRVGDIFLSFFMRDIDMDGQKPRNAFLKICKLVAAGSDYGNMTAFFESGNTHVGSRKGNV